jgi:hypothetical protein
MPMTNSTDTGVLENPNRRVKVYVLGGDGQWDDRGTGYVSCEMLAVSIRNPSWGWALNPHVWGRVSVKTLVSVY